MWCLSWRCDWRSFRPAQLHFLTDMDDMQLYVGRRISSAYSFCCIFPSFRVSRSLSRPFKALLAMRSRLLPYKAAALCSQSLTRNTDGPTRHKLSIIVYLEEAVRTVLLGALCWNRSTADVTQHVYSSLVRRIHLSLLSPSPPSALHHSRSCDFHPSTLSTGSTQLCYYPSPLQK